MFDFITWMKAIAAILITNSHFDSIYPIASLGTGGAFGNCLFFFASGYCLINIPKTNSIKTFIGWYLKRFFRIYPICFVTSILNAIFKLAIGEGFDLVQVLKNTVIILSGQWFVLAILVLYVFYYWCIRLLQEKAIKPIHVFGIVAIVYFALYFILVDRSVISIENNSIFKWVFYFGIMMFGYVLRTQDYKPKHQSSALWLVLSLVSIGAFYLTNIVLRKVSILLQFQFVLHAELAFFTWCFASYMIGIERKLGNIPVRIKRAVKYLSSITLEIYLVQMFVIFRANQLIFPVSFFVAVVIILLTAAVVHYLSGYIVNFLMKILNRMIPVEQKSGR